MAVSVVVGLGKIIIGSGVWGVVVAGVEVLGIVVVAVVVVVAAPLPTKQTSCQGT